MSVLDITPVLRNAENDKVCPKINTKDLCLWHGANCILVYAVCTAQAQQGIPMDRAS